MSGTGCDPSLTCPPPPELTPEEKDNAAAEIMAKLNLRACERDNSIYESSSVTAEGKVGWTGGSAKLTKTNTKVTKNTAIGCEQLTAIAQSYKASQRNVTCILNKTCNKQTASVDLNQVFRLTGCKDLKIGKDAKIIQRGKATLIQKFTLSDEAIAEIATQTKNTTEQLADIFQKAKTEYNKPGSDGAKLAAQLKVDIQNIDYKAKIKEKIQEFNSKAEGRQTIDWSDQEGSCEIDGEITQDMQLDVVAEAITTDISKDKFSTIVDNTNKQTSKVIQETESTSPTNWTIIIIIAVIAIVVIILLYFAFSSKSNQPQYYGTPSPYGIPSPYGSPSPYGTPSPYGSPSPTISSPALSTPSYASPSPTPSYASPR